MDTKSRTFTPNSIDFKDELSVGLFKKPKSISSKFFYDKKGDELFQKIMNLDEYYLTNCELEIFDQQKDKILSAIDPERTGFNLIELGAGDGSKTRLLIDHFLKNGVDFSYHPVDISKNVLDILEKDLLSTFPLLKIETVNKEYFEAINYMKQIGGRKNVILFLGSNIGNFDQNTRDSFFKSFQETCHPNDQLLIGVDLKKDPSIILKAYSDSEGVTAQFNINLLHRANTELGANFDLDQFKHYASYNPENGEARSYLISLIDQEVYIEALDKSVPFLKSEYIHTEISKKYNLSELEKLSESYGFFVEKHFMDEKEKFVDSLWTLK